MTKDDRSSAPPSSDRRSDERYLACFPAYLELAPQRTRMALIRDISTTGALLFTQTALKPDERVALKLYVEGDPEKARVTSAVVVRFERRSFDRADIWPYSVAVRFEQPLVDLAEEVEALAARQAKLGLQDKPKR